MPVAVKLKQKPNANLKEGSTRMRVFKALYYKDNGDGLSSAQIREMCGLSLNSGHVFSILVQEMDDDHKRIYESSIEDENEISTTTFKLNAKGRKDFERNKIDSRKGGGKRVGRHWDRERRQRYEKAHA